MSLCINPKCPQQQNSDQMLFCQSCGSELLLAGKYQATRLMSDKGGFGDTYEVAERGVPKVLKVLKSNNTKAIELFEREFRVLSSLTGENISGIPRVEDFFLYSPKSQPALHCLVMERINGMDLEEYIQAKKQPIDEKTATGWLSQLTNILQEIHSRGIFHRDIKPSNIILQPDGQLVLIDFGAVKEAAVNSSGQSTQIYTPGYAAPEQQQMGGASAQSDFFSLGRTFTYLLTEKSPIDLYDASLDSLVWREQTTNVSANFLNLIDCLMQKDFHQRPASTAAIFQEITALTPIATRPSGGSFPPQSALKINAAQASIPPNRSAPVASKSAPSNIFLLLAKNWFPLLIILSALLSLAAWMFLNQRQIIPMGTNVSAGQSFTAVKNVPTGVFKFGGSTTWATTRQLQSSIDAAIKGVFPTYDITYADSNSADIKSAQDGRCDKNPGSNAGICWLIEGDLDFAQSSIALDKSKYADRIEKNKLTEKPVAYDALVVVVNPQLKISGLTVEQLRGIYTGKITNWRQVSGLNLPIAAFSRTENAGGSVSSFKDLVLQKGDELKPQLVGTTTEGLQRVGKTLGGIYYGAAKEVMTDFCGVMPLAIGTTANNLVKPYQEPLQSPAGCGEEKRNELNPEVIKNQAYPLTRKIYVVVKADGTDRQKAGEAYANLLQTKQGQDLLRKAGFVSINN
jgi:serine/threonine protein kinase